MATERGWASVSENDRETKVVDGCLLTLTMSGDVSFPSKSVLVCKFVECSARSDHVGSLPCKGITTRG